MLQSNGLKATLAAATLSFAMTPGLLQPVDADVVAAPALPSKVASSAPVELAEPDLVPHLSSETVSTRQAPDGTLTSEVYPTAVNYQDESGAWHPIDNTLEDLGAGPYEAANASNDYTALIPKDASVTPVRFLTDAGWITMRLHGAEDAPNIDDAEAVFTDVADAASVTYTATNEGLKEEIELAQPPIDQPVYAYTIRTSPGLNPRLTPEGTIAFEYADGDPVAVIPPGTMWDSAEPAPSISEAVRYELDQTELDSWTLRIVPNLDWLQDPTRQYPVIVDPTITNSAPATDCWINESIPTQTACGASSIYLKAGRSGGAYRSLLKFSLASLPSTAQVSSASLSLWLHNNQTVNPWVPAGIYGLFTPGKNFDNGANWRSAGAAGNWATPGGDPSATRYGTTFSTSGDEPTNSWKTITGLQGLVQGWITGSIPQRGMLLKQAPETRDTVLSFSSASGAHPPKLTITYSVPNAAPSVPSLSVGSCYQPCSADSIVTQTTTPTISARSTDSDTASLNYAFEIRDNLTQVEIVSSSLGRPQGQSAAWTVPADNLADLGVYDVRVTASDGTSSVPGPWVTFGVDQDDPPAFEGVSITPCEGDCPANMQSLSTIPIIAATFEDPDDEVIAGVTASLRDAVTQAIVHTADLGPAAGFAEYKVPDGVLENNHAYEVRFTASDETSTIHDAWRPVTVTVPSGSTEPTDLKLATCSSEPCVWVDNTTTPTIEAVSLDPDADLVFEISQDDYTLTHEVTDPALDEETAWTVADGNLGLGDYSVRVGARDETGAITWTASNRLVVADGETGSEIPASEDGFYEDGTAYAAGPAPLMEGSEYAPGSADDPAVVDPTYSDPPSKTESAQAAAHYTTAQLYVPVFRWDNDETRYPLGADTFLGHSDLTWSHGFGCDDKVMDTTPDEGALGRGDYYHDSVRRFCGHVGYDWRSNVQGIRPRTKGYGPGDNDEEDAEGMFLDINSDEDDVRKGYGLNRAEPIFVQYTPYQQLQYWFLYGDSRTKFYGAPIPTSGHQGDWEHVSIQLDSRTNRPVRVAYFYHERQCTLPWSRVPKYGGGNHPYVEIAKGSHASYPKGMVQRFGPAKEEGNGDGAIYYPRDHIKRLGTPATPWTNYTGGWGEVGQFSQSTGPDGPHPGKTGKNQFGGATCK